MADNRTNPTLDPNRPTDPRNGPGKQGNLGTQGSETFTGEHEPRQLGDEGDAPRPDTQPDDRQAEERDATDRVE